MADWSDLPHDLLILIAKRVQFLEDFIAFSKVCTSWRSAATKNNYTNTFPQIPWLFLTQEHQQNTSQLQKFVTLKNCSELHKVILPKPTSEFLYFSSLGWFLAHENIRNIYLLHPVSRAQITLPTIPHSGYYAGYKFGDITKFVLSHSPSVTCNYLVMLAFGCLGLLAFCRHGDANFTTTKKWGAQIFDITYYDNKLYGVDAVGCVFVCDIYGPNPTEIRFVMDMGVDVQRADRLYILELRGRLVVVLRRWQVGEAHFWIFEINLLEQRWSEITDIGDMAIFLGLNSSFAVEACEQVHGCRANCIYVTSDYFDVLKYPIGTQCEYLLNGRVTKARDFGKRATGTWIEPSF